MKPCYNYICLRNRAAQEYRGSKKCSQPGEPGEQNLLSLDPVNLRYALP